MRSHGKEAAMTDQQINIAIAESLGWKLLANNRWTKPCGIYADLPDYTSDLNACHEFERMLTIKQSSDYVWNLNHYHPTATIHDFDDLTEMRTEAFKIVNATARQRCEAYLRTLGKWIE